MIFLDDKDRQGIADALQDTRGEHDRAIMWRYDISREDLAEIAWQGGSLLWCEGCTRWIAWSETNVCTRKRKGCVAK